MARVIDSAPSITPRQVVPLWARSPEGVAFADLPVREGGRMPDFCIVGTAKGGTTSVDRYLALHPDIFVLPQKEIHYFSTPAIRDRGDDWYTGLFADARPDQICGEASTSYSRTPLTHDCAGRMAAANPAMKLVYIVREPVSRLQSELQQTMKFLKNVMGHDLTHMPLDDFMDMVETPDHEYYQASADACRYDMQIAALEEHFPPEQILVLLFDDLLADEAGTIRRIFDFLGVAPDIPLDRELRTNVTADFHKGLAQRAFIEKARRVPFYPLIKRALPGAAKDRIIATLRRRPPPATMRLSEARRRRLAEDFAPHVEALEAYLGRSLPAWHHDTR